MNLFIPHKAASAAEPRQESPGRAAGREARVLLRGRRGAAVPGVLRGSGRGASAPALPRARRLSRPPVTLLTSALPGGVVSVRPAAPPLCPPRRDTGTPSVPHHEAVCTRWLFHTKVTARRAKLMSRKNDSDLCVQNGRTSPYQAANLAVRNEFVVALSPFSLPYLHTP